MELERTPVLEGLERFAQELPAGQRARLFKTAEAFLCVGAMHGIFGALNPGSPGDQQEQYRAYLQKKTTEYTL